MVFGSLELLKELNVWQCSRIMRVIFKTNDLVHVVINVIFEYPPTMINGEDTWTPSHPTLMLVGEDDLKGGLMELLWELYGLYDCNIMFLFLYYPRFLFRSSFFSLHYLSPFYSSEILIPQYPFSFSTSFSISFDASFCDVSHIYLKYSFIPPIIPFILPPPPHAKRPPK